MKTETSGPDQRITPVILCGGAGTRLWPLSTQQRPKQLLTIGGEATLLQQAALRTNDKSLFTAPIVVANVLQADVIEEQLQEIACFPAPLVLEPVGRNTAAAIAIAALACDPATIMLVMPSDHLIGKPQIFLDAVRKAHPLASNGWLVTFGIEANNPETGFGYIKRGSSIGSDAHQVARFVEKPPLALAEQMLADGGHSWNAGIFLMRAGSCLDALARHAPDILEATRAAMNLARRQGSRILPDPEQFAACPANSIDYAVMEHENKVAVVEIAMDWSDIGSWDAVHAIGPADEARNVTKGDVFVLDTDNCLILSEGPAVATMGIRDLIIISTPEQILIVPREQSQCVKSLVEALKART